MVPARLTLRNFLSYAEACPPLELEGIGIACLSGDNGHGKSSLIDAITWALWGRARGRDLDALVHRGRREMEVDFEFLAGDARYRVIRRRQRIGGKGGGRPGLEFQVWDGLIWRPLTEPTIAQTEQAIERTLHLSYDTFINSALLLQGKADLFAAAGPANRKRVLAEILDLGKYDLLEAEARLRRKQCAEEVTERDRIVADLERRIAPLPELRARICAAHTEMGRILSEQAALQEDLRDLQAAQMALESQRVTLADLKRQHVEDQRSLDSVESDLAALSITMAADEPLLAAAPAIRRGFERLERARETERQWTETLGRVQALDRRMQPLQQRIAGAEARREAQTAVLRARLAEAKEETRAHDTVREEHHALLCEERALEKRHAQAAALQSSRRECDLALVRLRFEEAALRATLTGIESQHALIGDAPEGTILCPTCQEPLAPHSRRELVCRLASQEKAAAVRLEEVRRAIGVTEKEIGDLAAQEATIRGGLEGSERQLRDRIARASALLEHARSAADRVRSLALELDEFERKIAGAVPESDATLALKGLITQRDVLGYDAAKHRAVSRRVEQLREYESRHHQLLLAEVRRDANTPVHRRQESIAESVRTRILQTEERIDGLRRMIGAMPDRSDRLRAVGDVLATLEGRRTALDRSIGGLEAQARECEGLAESIERERAALETARRDESIYADLVTAFGRNGVQAFIVEAVVPEIEAEANRLLAMMSEGRMTVRLETQRATRAGDLAETLDIVIADESGPRDYEMYSGGEAFRINLALRIALSKLLARRAGAPLPTLIIDEGFGSQDAAGRERLIEAVTAIRADFRCLLVVTHIKELKQLFDTRIEVHKGARGSIAEVVRV